MSLAKKHSRTLTLASSLVLLVLYLVPIGLLLITAASDAVAIDGTIDGHVVIGTWVLVSLFVLPAYLACMAFWRYRQGAPRAVMYMRVSGAMALVATFFMLFFFLGSVLRPDAEGGLEALISGLAALLLVLAGTRTLAAPNP